MALLHRRATSGRAKNKPAGSACTPVETGKPPDRSEASRDFRVILDQLPSASMNEYANECLTQTLVNAGL